MVTTAWGMPRPQQFGRNLDAFNDILRGGFGVNPPFTLIITHTQHLEECTAVRWSEIVEILEDEEHDEITVELRRGG